MISLVGIILYSFENSYCKKLDLCAEVFFKGLEKNFRLEQPLWGCIINEPKVSIVMNYTGFNTLEC